MPMIDPVWSALMRRQWPLVAAGIVFLLFVLCELLWFRPVVRRFDAVLKQGKEMGMALDPTQAPAVLPPRVFALLVDNTLPAAVAQQQGASGALTAKLLEDLTALSSKHGIQVLATEPGSVTQQPHSVQVRAHLNLRCRYNQFVTLLDDLASGAQLYSIDRFSLRDEPSGGEALEIWVSRYVLKQGSAPE
jgi:hypothetical protein